MNTHLYDNGRYPGELLQRAREGYRTGMFTRAVIQRAPSSFFLDTVTLACGHVKHETALVFGRDETPCCDCLEEWLEREAGIFGAAAGDAGPN